MKVYFKGEEVSVVLEHKDLDKIMKDIRFYGGFAYYEFKLSINEVLTRDQLKDYLLKAVEND